MKNLIMKQLRVLVVLLLVLSLGVGTTIVQVIGWATMIPTQLAKTGSVEQAVENTFSGEYPCPMCKLAAMKREMENNAPPIAPKQKEDKTKLPVLYASRILPVRIYPPAAETFPFPQSFSPTLNFSSSPDSPPPDVFVALV